MAILSKTCNCCKISPFLLFTMQAFSSNSFASHSKYPLNLAFLSCVHRLSKLSIHSVLPSTHPLGNKTGHDAMEWWKLFQDLLWKHAHDKIQWTARKVFYQKWEQITNLRLKIFSTTIHNSSIKVEERHGCLCQW